jgi:hypothetical protein
LTATQISNSNSLCVRPYFFLYYHALSHTRKQFLLSALDLITSIFTIFLIEV